VISRRRFLTAGAIALAPIGAAAHAQQYKAQLAGKVYRVGVLSPFSSSFVPGPSFEAFRQTLRELNYVEGRNITLEYRWAERMTLSLNITP
jgi:hypothetical protein